ncbi:MAG: Dps family protein [Paenibacillus macerans]|uniref:DNA starvation/stationary phase protection protein n=1 Tax=Paenibacillus macerans TaxID=44252 RepID=A0A6N8F1E5_PAEMA|nr:Dps family protein [Paenibacillus macerans]MBS5911913.1 DNA starvation/stationary phase protection protein [Paenibacillus macerans]MCY7561932.1 DNA starvation/stationary phase protection protein [Paenibacillus macerans]MDU5948159.1 Dps family protein [Paenibacillus macerans]MDU7474255.1 Dps family protein [Paenibacillus macerans]MEC0153668.1 DNA starvation/stationary phase protection protein [Paenibacillus macerans]
MANQTMTQVDQQLQKQLNLQIANWTLMYTKLHNFHWFVKGSNFFTLHEKFESLYDEAAGYIDDIAERLLAIGGTPVATLRESLAIASLQEASGKETADEMVAAIVADFETLSSDLKDAMETAARVEDEATGDLLLGVLSALDKHRWMLNAYLGK